MLRKSSEEEICTEAPRVRRVIYEYTKKYQLQCLWQRDRALGTDEGSEEIVREYRHYNARYNEYLRISQGINCDFSKYDE